MSFNLLYFNSSVCHLLKSQRKYPQTPHAHTQVRTTRTEIHVSGSADIFHFIFTSIIHMLKERILTCPASHLLQPNCFNSPTFDISLTGGDILIELESVLCLFDYLTTHNCVGFCEFSMTCLLKRDTLAPQLELAADGCLIILLIQSCISSVNNLAQRPHYISPYPKPVRAS